MKQKTLGLLFIALMLLLIGLQLQEDSPEGPGAGETGPLLAGLQANLDLVKELQVLDRNGSVSVTITNDDGGWRILEKSGYPADFAVFSGLLRDIAGLEIAERKTARAENHGLLGLASEGDTAGIVVRVIADQDYEMMVGNAAQAGGTFVRRPGEDQVYLVAQSLEVSNDPVDYLDPVFLSLESSEVQSVRIESPGSLLIAVRDAETGKMTIDNLPEDAELRYDTVADSLARLFVNLRFEDVEPYQPAFFSTPGETSVTLASGESQTIWSERIAENYWVSLDQQWQFRVSEYTYNQLNKTMQDMLKEESTDDD